MKRWKKIVLSLFVICVLVVGGGFGYAFYQLSKMSTTKISKTDADLGIKSTAITKVEQSTDITNVALFGVDRRNKSDAGRSDSMIVLSIDQKHKKIKMSSLMRDFYVSVDGHGQTKLTHAYAYGGPQLAIKTINENFNLDIRDYVTVDFYDLEKLIDALGGVKINVEQDEVSLINSYMSETARIEKKSFTKVTGAGPQNLSGIQAVAYSRIRYTSGDDFKRTERQRTVLTGMFTKIQSVEASEFPSVVSNLLPFTETSMNSIDIMKLGTKVIASKSTTSDQARFPVDGYWEGKMMSGVWYLVADMKATVNQLHKYIYDDIKPVAK
ncbi:LCP family protein [Clostridium algoriphilum]|uniref:LCP family protein n=1 Tax=Clostridium algoriphilum TaxID=198347 RepID=UPI001CF20F68|nr:LCP family protein [Clostridium algoriphilum]MCB2293545.1 LCP family protein [Clostridium algoriphilum]